MENVTLNVVDCFVGYVFIEGVLAKSKINLKKFDLVNNIFTYQVTPITEDAKTFEMENVLVYKNVDDFKLGCPSIKNITKEMFLYYNLMTLPFRVNRVGEDIFIETYKLENGQIVKKNITDDLTEIVFQENDKIITNISTEGCYETKEALLAWEEINVSDEKGVRKSFGIAKKLQLTDEQKQLIEKFKGVIQEMNEKNITMVYYPDIEDYILLNGNEVDLIFDEEKDFITKEGYEVANKIETLEIYKSANALRFDALYMNCNSSIGYRKKKS